MTVAAARADLVAANHILAAEQVTDAYGHVSCRHPEHADRYLIARAIAPELVTAQDIMEVGLDGTVLGDDPRKAYLERHIHGAIYERRADVTAVVHAHAPAVLPFSVTDEKLRPILHSAAPIGTDIPTWDTRNLFGDTALLVSDLAMGRDLARVLDSHSVVLMRGHGCAVVGHSIREAVYTAINLQVNARVQIQAARFSPVTYLSDGEVDTIRQRLARAHPGEGYDRAWTYWARRAGIRES